LHCGVSLNPKAFGDESPGRLVRVREGDYLAFVPHPLPAALQWTVAEQHPLEVEWRDDASKPAARSRSEVAHDRNGESVHAAPSRRDRLLVAIPPQPASETQPGPALGLRAVQATPSAVAGSTEPATCHIVRVP
jgi:hypothetical protein